MNHQPINRRPGRGFGRNPYPAYRTRPRPGLVTVVVYLLALATPVLIALSAVGSSPALLDRVVPSQFRDTVAALGRHAPTSGDGDLVTTIADRGVGGLTFPGASTPPRDGWSTRHPDDYPPPPGLERGVDYSVTTSDDGYVSHWPCADEIPVWSFDAPPGSEPDLAWAVETLASASGLPLRYAGYGTPESEGAEGGISVTYGDHPDFHGTDVAGVGGATVWSGGLITEGRVVLRPDQITPAPGDPWSRSLTLHELMHAVGVNHAAPHLPEIMAERQGALIRTDPGHGDRFALHMVGCH